MTSNEARKRRSGEALGRPSPSVVVYGCAETGVGERELGASAEGGIAAGVGTAHSSLLKRSDNNGRPRNPNAMRGLALTCNVEMDAWLQHSASGAPRDAVSGLRWPAPTRNHVSDDILG
jgi:hypothetical protein